MNSPSRAHESCRPRELSVPSSASLEGQSAALDLDLHGTLLLRNACDREDLGNLNTTLSLPMTKAIIILSVSSLYTQDGSSEPYALSNRAVAPKCEIAAIVKSSVSPVDDSRAVIRNTLPSRSTSVVWCGKRELAASTLCRRETRPCPWETGWRMDAHSPQGQRDLIIYTSFQSSRPSGHHDHVSFSP